MAAASPARAALQGWWKFDEAGGTVAADSSGQTPANGTLIGGATFQPAAGRFGGAVYLNGTSGFVDAGDVARFEFAAAQSFTVACWFKSDGDETVAEYQTNNGLVSKGYGRNLGSPAYDAAGYYQLQFNGAAGNTNSYFQFDSRQSSSQTSPFRFPTAFPAGSQDVVNNAWHHFVAVIDRGAATPQCRLYLNNVLYATNNFTSATAGGQWAMGVNASSLIIGNHLDRYTRGWMDDVGVWNQVLTAGEISAIYTGGISSIAGFDTDNDTLPDVWENANFNNLDQVAAGDPDSDGLSNYGEFTAGTNPNVPDTDGDGLSDGAEKNTYLTNPLVADTDGDTLSDGAEVNTYFTNPLKRDTDGDNWNDNEEIAGGTNPLLASSRPAPATGTVHINEFVAQSVPKANGTWMPLDMDGDAEDWIELRNTGAAAIDLIDWQLSDDEAVPAKWRFPHVSIPAGGYLLVYASGKNKSFNGVQPHTNFKLGETGAIVLSRPDGLGGTPVMSQIGSSGEFAYTVQKQRASYGRADDTAAGVLAFLTVPTPGAANNTASAVTEFVRDTVFSTDGGLYSASVPVTITCSTQGSTIAYTLNGSEPSPTNGTQVPAPDSLSPATANLTITATTLLRARAWKTGMGASNVDTQSYIFPANVMTQNGPTPSMGVGTAADTATGWGLSGTTPMVLAAFPGLTQWGVNPAIATDANPDNQFRQNDLMVLPTLSLVADWKDLFGPSAGQGIYPPASGVAQEGVDRAASLEFLNPGASAVTPNAIKGFQTDGNIHIFGGTSQARWKSLKLSFRFQCLNDVNYRVYGDDATNKFSNFVLDAAMNNTWMHPTDANQRIRSAFSRDYVMADLQNKMSGAGGFHTRACHLYLNGIYWGIYWLHEKPDHHFGSAYFGGDSADYDAFKHSATAGVDGAPSAYPQTVNTQPLDPALPLGSSTITALNSSSQFYNCTVLKSYEDMLDLIGSGYSAPNPVPDLTQPANYNAVAAVLDIDHFIDYMMLNFVGGNQDWADKNLYCGRSRAAGGKWRFASWDAEHTFRTGAENFIAGGGNEVPRAGQPKDIHNKLRVNADYKLRWADRVRKHMFNGGALTVPGMKAAFDFRHAELNDAIRAESARWGHTRASLRTAAPDNFPNIPYKRSDWFTETQRLTILESGGNSLMQNRWNLYMAPATGQFRLATYGLYPTTEAPDFSQHGGAVAANYALTITNPNAGGAGTTYYTLDGSDPRTSGTSAVAPGAQTYTAPVTLASSATVKSRILIGSVWSALNEASFSVDTVPATAANIVVSEFNYNPGNATAAELTAGFADANDFEYIELLNISASRVRLTGCQFNAGITFHFDNATIRELAPGERLVIVENAAAFAFRYGPAAAARIAGTFELGTNLSNSGETLRLIAADISVIKDFAYNDKAPWPVAADGLGWSLVLIHPETNPDHSIAQNWRPSAAINGTPGSSDTMSYATWKTAHGVTADHDDDDRDDTSNVQEYFFKTDPASPASRPAFTGGVQTISVDPGPGLPPVPGDYLTLTFDRDPAADDVTSTPEISTDLNNWSHSITDLLRVSVTPNPDGTQTELWRSTTPFLGDQRRYGRVRITVP